MAGKAARAGRDSDAALDWFRRAVVPQGDPQGPLDDGPYWQSLALRELGDTGASRSRAEHLLAAAREQSRAEARVPYFATSLPTLLLFDDDLGLRTRQEATYLEARGRDLTPEWRIVRSAKRVRTTADEEAIEFGPCRQAGLIADGDDRGRPTCVGHRE